LGRACASESSESSRRNERRLGRTGKRERIGRAAQVGEHAGLRKAAILLVAVGEELAKEILRALPEVDVQRLTEELADLRG